jgi:hypothetical protein
MEEKATDQVAVDLAFLFQVAAEGLPAELELVPEVCRCQSIEGRGGLRLLLLLS